MAPSADPRPGHRIDAVAAAGLVVMWSSGFIGAELGTRHAGADTLLAWRYVVAAAVLLTWAGVRRVRLTPGAWVRHATLGLLCRCLYLGGVVGGVGVGVPAETVALVAALQPLVVATLAGPVLGERTTDRQRWGLAAGVLGVALVVAGDLGAGAAAWAYLLPVGGMLALSAGTLLERWWRPPESLLVSLTVQTVTAAAFFVALAGSAGRLQPPGQAAFWWAVAWVVVLSGFGGYGCYLLVLRRSGATRVSTLLYLTPPTTTAWAYAMFGQVPGPLAVPGALVCGVAVLLALVPPSGAGRRLGRRQQ